MIRLSFGSGKVLETKELETKEHWYHFFLGVDEIALEGVNPKIEGTFKDPIAFYEALEAVLHASSLMAPSSDWKNTLENLFQLVKCFDLSKIKGRFEGMTAVLCGAGTSTFENQDALLKTREKAVLFGVGTGATLLDRMGVEPHFRVCRDPNVSTESKALIQHSVHTPFIMSGYTNPEVRKAQQGVVIYAPEEGATLECILARQLGRKTFLTDTGPSSGTYAIAVAKYLGFSKILLLGYDFEANYPITGLEHPTYTKQSSSSIVVVGGGVETTLQHLHELSCLKDSGVVNVSNPNWKCRGVKTSSLEAETKDLPTSKIDLFVHKSLQVPPSRSSTEIFYKELNSLTDGVKTFSEKVSALLKIEERKDWKYLKINKLCILSEKKRLLESLRNERLYPIFVPFDNYFTATLRAKKSKNEVALRMRFFKYLLKEFVLTLSSLSLPEYSLSKKKNCWQEELAGLKSATQSLYDDGAIAELSSSERGVSIKFDRLERLFSIEKFESGKRDGLQKWYYPTGQESLVSNYKKGLPHGEFSLYYPDGRLKRRMHFEKGALKGGDTFWDSQGKELYTHDF